MNSRAEIMRFFLSKLREPKKQHGIMIDFFNIRFCAYTCYNCQQLFHVGDIIINRFGKPQHKKCKKKKCKKCISI